MGLDRHCSLYNRWYLSFLATGIRSLFGVLETRRLRGNFLITRGGTPAVLFTTDVLEVLARRQRLQKCRKEGQYLPLTLNRFAKINQIPGDVARLPYHFIAKFLSVIIHGRLMKLQLR